MGVFSVHIIVESWHCSIIVGHTMTQQRPRPPLYNSLNPPIKLQIEGRPWLESVGGVEVSEATLGVCWVLELIVARQWQQQAVKLPTSSQQPPRAEPSRHPTGVTGRCREHTNTPSTGNIVLFWNTENCNATPYFNLTILLAGTPICDKPDLILTTLPVCSVTHWLFTFAQSSE